MSHAFEHVTAADPKLFFHSDDRHDVRLGELVAATNYADASIVILGCTQDEGIGRAGRRLGAKSAPDAIREQFYKFTPFGVSRRIHDLGNLGLAGSLEETHRIQTDIAKEVIAAGKKLIVLGGGGDVTYADGRAMSELFGSENWLGVNIDAAFDFKSEQAISADSAIRRLLDENLIGGGYLYEVGYQPHLASPQHYRQLQSAGAHLVNIDQLRSHETADVELRELMRQRFTHHSQSLTALFSFDMHAVRSSDAPGTSEPNPIGLRSGEFLNLVHFAAKLINTKIVEFTEVNPTADVDARTAKLVAVGVHRFCSSQPHIGA